MIEIIKWSETFENAAGRKLETITRFDHPAGCNSRGYRKLSRDGVVGMAAFGVFNALCQLMPATQRKSARKSGIFRNGDGSLMELADILDLTWLGSMPAAEIQELLGKLVAVGWIKIHNNRETNSLEIDPPTISQTSADLPPEPPRDSAGDMPPPSQSPAGDPPQSPGNMHNMHEQSKAQHAPPISPQGGTDVPTEISKIIPPGSRRKPLREQKAMKVIGNTPTMVKLGALFGRMDKTLWQVNEAIQLEKLNPTDREVAGICLYYESEASNPERITRRELNTLLNNWAGELDRARQFVKQHPHLKERLPPDESPPSEPSNHLPQD